MTRKINQFWQTKNSECFSCAAPTLESSSAWREVRQVNPRARAKWNRNEFVDAKWLHFMARNVRPKRKGVQKAPPANDTLKLRKGSRDFKAKRSECLKDAQTASMCVNLLSSSWKLEGCWRLSQVAQLPESDLPQVRLPQYKVAAELPTESDRRASALQLMNGFSMKPKTYVIEIKATTQSSRVKRLRQNIHVQPWQSVTVKWLSTRGLNLCGHSDLIESMISDGIWVLLRTKKLALFKAWEPKANTAEKQLKLEFGKA